MINPLSQCLLSAVFITALTAPWAAHAATTDGLDQPPPREMATAKADSAEEAPTALGPIIVEGKLLTPLTSPSTTEMQETIATVPGAMTLVKDDDDKRNHSNMADAMRYVPGLYINSATGGDEVDLSMRGSNLDSVDYDQNGILLLQDGIPVSTADGNNHNRVIDPLSAQSAMVAPGANGMRYGASTLGGAINFITPTAYDLPGITTLVNGGGYGQVEGRITAGKVLANGLDGLASIEFKQRDGFREHSNQRKTALYSNAGWRISDALDTRLYATYIDSDVELSGALTRAQFDANPRQASADALSGDYQKNVKTWRLASKTTWKPDAKRRLEVGLAYEGQQLYHPIVADFGGDNPFFDGLLIDTDHKNIATSVRYTHSIGNHELQFGVNYLVGGQDGEQYGNASGQRGDLQTLVDQNARTLQLYVMDHWQLGQRWTLVPGIQYIHARREINNTTVVNTHTPDPSTPPNGTQFPGHTQDSYSAVNPRLGVIYQLLPDVQVFANASRLYEPPTNFVLQNQQVGGGATLDAMEGTTVEIGTRGQHRLGLSSQWRWSLATYYSWIKNEILARKNLNQQAGQPRFFVNNVDKTVHVGIEALIAAHIALNNIHAIEPTLSLTVNQFKFDGDPSFGNNQLPVVPDYVLRGELLYKNSNGFYIGPTFDLVDDRFADYANSYNVDGYALVGLLAGWSDQRLRVYVEARNLTNKDYVSTLNVVGNASANDALLQAGAPLSVYAGMSVSW